MPIWLLGAWRFIRPLMPYIAAALVVLGLLSAYGHREYGRGKHSRDAEVSALQGTIANFKAASAKAKADNEANVARINGLQDQVTKDKNDEAPKQLADARAALAAYVLRHPAVHQGNAGQDQPPGIPDAPGKPDAAPSEAVVSVADLDACAVSYTTAIGLQDWIRREAAIDRGDGK